MECFVARQPIFTKNKKVYGYELLYRDSVGGSVSGVDNGVVDGSTATSETILNSFQNIGINKLTSGKRAFVNFTEDLILQEVATLLPRDTLVVEVLEGIEPSEKILKAIAELKNSGYMIALDDFVVDPANYSFFEYTDIIKFDLMSTPVDVIRPLAHDLHKRKIILLAEKIENAEVFEETVKMGFTLFQGYYFSKPTTLKQKKINPLRANCIHLINLAMQEEIDFRKCAEIIKQDVALSFSLLKLVNSAFFGLPNPAKSIQHAVSILGVGELTKWIILVSLSRMKDDKPDELVSMSLIRGRILETLSTDLKIRSHSNDLFLLGLLSFMDVLTDTPMEEVLTQVKLNEFVTDNLVGTGKYRGLLELLTMHEKGDWDEAIRLAESYGVDETRINELYLDALDWIKSISL